MVPEWILKRRAIVHGSVHACPAGCLRFCGEQQYSIQVTAVVADSVGDPWWYEPGSLSADLGFTHQSVAFDAHDKKPVDIICTILGPDQADCDHLKLVSAAAKHLANGAVCQALRRAKTLSDVRRCFDQHDATAA